MGVFVHRHEWTDERVALLRQLFPQGGHTWIAKQINERTNAQLTRNAVIGKCQREGLFRPKSQKDAHRKIANQIRRRGRVVAQKVVAVVPHEPEHRGLSVLELSPETCKFPKGETQITFCGHQSQPDSPYCSFHHRLCYTPPERRPSQPMRRAA